MVIKFSQIRNAIIEIKLLENSWTTEIRIDWKSWRIFETRTKILRLIRISIIIKWSPQRLT